MTDQGTDRPDSIATEYYVDGYDPNGIRRVWGYCLCKTGAMDQARLAASEYVVRRPDTRPVTSWGFSNPYQLMQHKPENGQ